MMRRFIIALATTTALMGAAHAQTTAPASLDMFVAAQPTDVLSYNLIGLPITNSGDETIGEIKDLILSDGKLTGFIVSVGGFLGMGERYVIVSPASVQVDYHDNDKKWTATSAATKDQLQAAPEFKYEGRWKR
jgi:hypothetical protein